MGERRHRRRRLQVHECWGQIHKRAMRKPREAISGPYPDSEWKCRSFFVASFLDGFDGSFFGFVRSDIGSFSSTGHGGAVGVNAPLALDVVLRFAKQFARSLRVASRKHGVARLLVGVLLQR